MKTKINNWNWIATNKVMLIIITSLDLDYDMKRDKWDSNVL